MLRCGVIVSMRQGTRFSCPECGDQSSFPATCCRCDVLLIDEHGNGPPPTLIIRRTAGPGGHSAPVVSTFRALAGEIGDMNRVRRARNALRKATQGWTEVDGTEWLKVSGQVRLLEAVHGNRVRGESSVACFRYREEVEDRKNDIHSTGKNMEERQGCGIFLITGGEHDVLVDEDFLQVVPPPGCDYRERETLVYDGDEVHALGPVVRRSVAELGLGDAIAGSSGYRRAQEVLCFAGRTGKLVSLQPLQKMELPVKSWF